MASWSGLLPITVVVAIVIFVAKEILEAVRRWGANKKKRAAISSIIRRDCELNMWTIRSLRIVLLEIQRCFREELDCEFEVIEKPDGRSFFRIAEKSGEFETGSALPPVYRNNFDGLALPIAEFNQQIFALFADALTALGTLGHVRGSLINHVMSDDPLEKLHFKDFPEYGLKELDDVEASLGALFLASTGERLIQFRLR